MPVYRLFGLSVFVLCLLSTPALAQTVAFVHDGTNVLLEENEVYVDETAARVRVTDPEADASPTVMDMVSVTVTTALSGDSEVVDLWETYRDSGVFEGRIRLVRNATPIQAGLLETGFDAGPPSVYETLTAEYGAAMATVMVVPARIEMLDEYGDRATSVANGDWVHVRLEDHVRADDPWMRDTVSVLVQNPDLGDSELLTLTETALRTGVFEGRIRHVPTSSSGDGVIGGAPFQYILASYDVPGYPEDAEDSASVTGSRVEVLGADGRPTDLVPESSPLRLRVTNRVAAESPGVETTDVELHCQITGDDDTVVLTETGPATGIFEGTIPTTVFGQAQDGDGTLTTGELLGPPHSFEVVHISYTDDLGGSGTTLTSVGTYASETRFTDAEGRDAETYAAGFPAWVWVEDHNANQPAVVDTIQATVESLTEGDSEALVLTETGQDTAIFSGSMQLAADPGTAGDGILQGQFDDTLRVLHGDALGMTASGDLARLRGNSLQFIDADGRAVGEVLENGTARVRVEMAVCNGSPFSIDTCPLVFTTRLHGDAENIQLTETGENTGVFVGEIPTPFAFFEIPYNGVLEIGNSGSPEYLPDEVTASAGSEFASVPTAPFTLRFVHADGGDAPAFEAGETVGLRLEDHTGNDPQVLQAETLEVHLIASTEAEPVTLTETGYDTGVYVGSVPSQLSASPTLNSGTLDVEIGSRLRVERSSATDLREVRDEALVSEAAGAADSPVRFVDAYGLPTDSYVAGSTAYVRVEDAAANLLPSAYDTVQVTVSAPGSGDSETANLLETARDSGIFEGSVPLSELQAGPGDLITVAYAGGSDQATIRSAAAMFIDEAGVPTGEVLENGVARLRVVGTSGGSTVGATLRSQECADVENVTLTETFPGSQVYEGTIQLAIGPPNDGTPQNGVLETTNSGAPFYRGDTLTLEYQDGEGTAVTVPSRVWFVDGYGRPAASFAVGEAVGVRVEDHNLDNPFYKEQIQVLVREAGLAYSQPLDLIETGYDTNVYEGSLPGGTLPVQPGQTIEAKRLNVNTPNPTVAQATIAGASVTFVDEQGQPADLYFERTRAFVRVIDPYADHNSYADFVLVSLSSLLGPDSEEIGLFETGGSTGVFEGWIPLGLAPASSQNGFLETGQYAGPPHEFDTLTASYASPYGTVTATAGTLASRTWFVDAWGKLADGYTAGTTAYVRVEDHVANAMPDQYDTVQVTISAPETGDIKTVTLRETARDSGIFEGSVRLETEEQPPVPNPGDGRLQSMPGEEIEAVHDDWGDGSSSSDTAVIRYSSAMFVDEAGEPTGEVLENGVARLRVIGSDPNPTVGATVRSLQGGDVENVTLTETFPGSQVYEGTLQLSFVPAGNAIPQNGVLDAANSGTPEYLGDRLTLEYQDGLATAVTIPSRVQFVDGFGRVVSTFAVTERVGVRVEDHNLDNPLVRSTMEVLVHEVGAGDSETVPLTETGYDTNVYEGGLASENVLQNLGDGKLQVQPGRTIAAERLNQNTPYPTVSEAVMAGASVVFLDEQGQPAELYFESTRAYVRVIDKAADHNPYADIVLVSLSSLLGLDDEQIGLFETGGSTGVFEGSLPLSVNPESSNNGILETGQFAGPPHEFDTLTASYSSTSGTVTDTAGTIGARVWFVDAWGNLADGYTAGTTAFVRVQAPNANATPSVYDTVQVTLSAPETGDSETLTLRETARDSGIFEGSLPLDGENAPPVPVAGDGRLQSMPGEEIEAVYTAPDGNSSSSDTAEIRFSSAMFVDEAGEPTGEVLESGVARLRVLGLSPGSTVGATVRSLYGGDVENVTLAETFPGSQVYEGTLQLSFVPHGGGTSQNGVLDAANSDMPEYLGDELSVEYQDGRGTAVTVPSRVRFLDGFGGLATAFAVGEQVGVRVEDHNLDNPLIRSTMDVLVHEAGAGDAESVTLTETGYDTNVYEGSLASEDAAANFGDGKLQVQPGDEIEAERLNLNTPYPTVARAAMAGAAVVFLDDQGQPAELYFERTQARVRVTHKAADFNPYADMVMVSLSSMLGLDSEQITLFETGGSTGVFEGSISLSTDSASSQNGILETGQFAGPPHEYDTLTASYSSATGTVTDTAGTIGSRTWFIDNYGNEADGYAAGSTARVRVRDHNADQPGVNDTVQVTLRSLTTGDLETATLYQVAGEGLFEEFVTLERTPIPAANDGKLQSMPGEEIEVVYAASSDRALIRYAKVLILDPTVDGEGEVLENGQARIQVIDTTAASGFGVTVRSRYAGDEETVSLSSWGQGTWQGLVPLSFVPPGSGVPNNGVLETSNSGGPEYLQDELTAEYLDDEGRAVTVPSRIGFLNLVEDWPTAEYAVGSLVRVRVQSEVLNDPGQVDTTTAVLGTPGTPGDTESVTLTETWAASGIFLGELPSSAASGAPGDGTLTAGPGAVATVEHPHAHTPVPTRVQLPFNGNFAPQAAPDAAETLEGQPVTIDVLANDSDPDQEALAIGWLSSPANGGVHVESGMLVYTPDPELVGTDTFTYVAVDPRGGQARGTVTVTVLQTNSAPVAVDDFVTIDEDGAPVAIDVVANDTDADDDPLQVTFLGQPSSGTAELQPDGTVLYTPAPNANGVFTFIYHVSDPSTSFHQGLVTVTVNPVNDPPVAVDDAAATDEDTAVTVAVLANDTDVENDTLDVYLVTAVMNGSAVINADETVTFTPAAGYHGTASFYYEMRDGNGGTDVGLVTVIVNSVNDPPVAVDDSYGAYEDTETLMNVLDNDSDGDNDTLTVTAVTQGTNGSVTLNPVTYTPNANFNGADSFTYTISDGNGGTDTATVTVTVTPVNDAPATVDDAASVVEDGSVTVNVLGNDSDIDNDTLTVTAVTQGTNGAVTLDPVTYTPAPNFFGTDSFTYTISDGNGGTDTATVTVTIAPSNDALTANDDSATLAEDGSATVAVLANDTDPENDVLSVQSVTQGTNGSVAINPDKTVTYTPNADFHGADSFTYTASDGNGGLDSATVSVTVTPVNDAPVAGDDTASVVEDGSVAVTVLGNDADADDDLLTVTAVTQGANGSVTLDPITYTPNANFNGTDSFTYTISDGNGGEDTATVTVTVSAANDAPVANDDSASTAEDNPVTVSVLGNDTDLENDTLSVSAVTQGANGAVAIAGNQVTYTPGANFNGADSFIYTASDGNGGTDTATVTVTVSAVNDAPVANDDPASVAEDGSVTVAVLANDTDVENDTLTVTAVTQGAHGTVTLNPVTYTPATNYNGADSFTYTISDGNGGTDTASVNVTVGAANDAPDAVDDTATVAEDGSVQVSVLANDTDLDNDTLTVTAVTQGANGTVTLNPVTYTPNANFFGTDSFTYTASDGNGGTDTATVNVTVTAVNDAPVAVDDSAATLAETPVTIQVRNNDTDVDSATLTITAVTQGAHGTVAINAGQTVTYTPATAWVGPDTFTYTISDGAGGTSTGTVSVDVQAPPRVSANIQVLYAFDEGSGTTVNDTSGVGTPLNLTVGSASAVTWLPGALSINSNTLVQTAGAATKVINACKASNEVTVEAWVDPLNLTQTGPAAIVTLSQNATKRDVTLGQSGTAYNGQLRTSSTGQGGTQHSADGVASLNLTHVVYTRSSTGAVRIYVNGAQAATGTLSGNLSSWASYNLALGGELSGTRYWRGELHLVAIYSRALTAAEVRQNWLAGAN